MSDSSIRRAFGLDGEDDGVAFEIESRYRALDDGPQLDAGEGKIVRLMETLTRVGGEVCRLRADVDGLLESSKVLQERFERLRDVIEEKGTLNMDDFELACEVMTSRQATRESQAADASQPIKKVTH